MKRFSSSLIAPFALSIVTGCFGVGDEDLTDDPTDEVAATFQELGSSCGIEPNGDAYCAETDIQLVMGRKVYYRVGANSGSGYDPATGRHSAVVLFQGSSFEAGPENTTGGANGPGATWSQARPNPGPFAVWNQIATVIALIDDGYTVIQPAARFREAGESSGYFWDTNILFQWNNGADKPLVGALIAALQPASTTFGAIDINHVYAMGISSGGFMCSRIANDFAGGVNNNSTAKLPTTKPFRAVAIHSASYQICGMNCPPSLIPSVRNLPATHAPTLFMHDVNDPVVKYEGMVNYLNRLDAKFPSPGENPNYTVNGVPQEFTRATTFDGDAGPFEGHQWSDDMGQLTPGLDNDILVWFNEHR